METTKKVTQKELDKLWAGTIQCLNFDLRKNELEIYINVVHDKQSYDYRLYFGKIRKIQYSYLNDEPVGRKGLDLQWYVIRYEEIIHIPEAKNFDKNYLDYDYCIDGDDFEMFVKADIVHLQQLFPPPA